MKFKQMKVSVNNLQVGDFVMAHKKDGAYFIKDIGKTFLHKHIIFNVVYIDGESFSWSMELLMKESDKRDIIRVMRD